MLVVGQALYGESNMKELMKEVEYTDERGDIIFIDKVPFCVYNLISAEFRSDIKTATAICKKSQFDPALVCETCGKIMDNPSQINQYNIAGFVHYCKGYDGSCEQKILNGEKLT